MEAATVLLLAFGLGFVAGLRSMTAPAVVAWGARLGWLKLQETSLGLFAHPTTLVVLSLAAVGEYVGDKLPKTPSRKAVGPFAARIVLGGLCGAALALDSRQVPWLGIVAGAAGAVVGTLGGYAYRMKVPRKLRLADFPFAVLEDLTAIGLGFLIVSRFA